MALSAKRALQVLDFLTVNERGAFTLSELSKALDVSTGSMFAVLKSMSDEGYVTRHPRHKTYVLGPAAAAVGHAADSANPVIELARTEMAKLASASGYECSGTVLAGRDILCIAVKGRPTGRQVELAPGQRIPLMPPFGQAFMAWMAPAELSNWITVVPNVLQDRVSEYLAYFGSSIRERGYTIGLEDTSPARRSLTRNLAEHPNQPGLREESLQHFFDEQPNYALLDIDAEGVYDVGNIAAPVFDPDGRVAMCLALLHLGKLEGSKIPDAAQPVKASAQLLTKQIGGRAPDRNVWNDSR